MNDNFEEENQGEPIGDIIRRDYLPYWPMILVVGLLGLVVAYAVNRYTKPLYVAEAKIMFKGAGQEATQQVLVELTGLRGQAQDKTKQNLEILQSYRVAMEAINSLQIHMQLYSVGTVVKVPQYKKSPLFSCVFLEPDSIRSFSGEIKYDNNKKKFFVEGKELCINKTCVIGGNKILLSMETDAIEKLKSEANELRIFSNE